MKLLNSVDWLKEWISADPSIGPADKRIIHLLLLDEDIRSVHIALSDYLSAREHLAEGRTEEVIHYGKSFVCAMRRVGHLLESLSVRKSIFPNPVADTIKVTWRKKKAMFDTYINARNAIEHIDGEIHGKTHLVLISINNDRLLVTEKKYAQISEKNYESAVNARNEIIESVLQHIKR